MGVVEKYRCSTTEVVEAKTKYENYLQVAANWPDEADWGKAQHLVAKASLRVLFMLSNVRCGLKNDRCQNLAMPVNASAIGPAGFPFHPNWNPIRRLATFGLRQPQPAAWSAFAG